MGPLAYFFWGRDFDFQGHRGHKGRIPFPEHNSVAKGVRAINLKLATDTCLRSGKMPIHFWVTILNSGISQ